MDSTLSTRAGKEEERFEEFFNHATHCTSCIASSYLTAEQLFERKIKSSNLCGSGNRLRKRFRTARREDRSAAKGDLS